MTAAPITVCIGTYGDRKRWSDLAQGRAMASVNRQTLPPEDLHWHHGTDLHDARNTAAAGATSDWLCFLDADDELDESYLEAMTAAIATTTGPALVQPSTLGVHPDGHEDPHPVLIPPRPLLTGNYLVIGTLIRADQFERLGGFHQWPCFEDWDLWLRAWLDGADLMAATAAIYRVHVTPGSRNTGDRHLLTRTYHQIRNRHLSRAP